MHEPAAANQSDCPTAATPIDGSRQFRLLYYISATDRTHLEQGFFGEEVAALRSNAMVSSVHATNRLTEVWTQDYDAVISYFYSYSAIVAMIARLRGKRVIVVGGAEQILREMAPSTWRYLTKMSGFFLTLFWCTKILAASRSDLSKMRRAAFFKRSAIELSFHGTLASSQLDRTDFQRPRERASMITICGMDSECNLVRKGVLRAIKLLANTREIEPEARLVVVGRDAFGEMAREYARALNCENAVILKGFVSNEAKYDLLRTARYYLQLSDYEGFGVGALEALALGCEVIHSNVGGLCDTIMNYGRVLSHSDVQAIDLDQPYDIRDWAAFQSHMAQFSIEKRVQSLLRWLVKS
jgi:glycosyltransferase involved in cell wall biosynthesis